MSVQVRRPMGRTSWWSRSRCRRIRRRARCPADGRPASSRAGVERALRTQQPLVAARVAAIRRKRPQASPAEVIDLLGRGLKIAVIGHRRRRRRDRGRARHRHRRVAGHRERRGARGARRDGALRPRRRRGARAPHRNRGTTPGARPGRDHGRGRAGDAAEGHGQVRRLGPGHHQRAAPEQARPAQHHTDPLVHQALRDQADRARARAGAAARHRSRGRRRRELRDRPRCHQGGRARIRAASRPVARRHPVEPAPDGGRAAARQIEA